MTPLVEDYVMPTETQRKLDELLLSLQALEEALEEEVRLRKVIQNVSAEDHNRIVHIEQLLMDTIDIKKLADEVRSTDIDHPGIKLQLHLLKQKDKLMLAVASGIFTIISVLIQMAAIFFGK